MTNDMPSVAEDLDINEVEVGYIIYQKDRDKVHYLNKTAVLVLELCTGKNTRADIERILMEAYELPEAPTDEVGECLAMLTSEELIT